MATVVEEGGRAPGPRIRVGIIWLGKVSRDTGGRTYLTEILRLLVQEPDLELEVHLADRAFAVPPGCRVVYHRVPRWLGLAGRVTIEPIVALRHLRSCDILLAPFGNVPPTWRRPVVVVVFDLLSVGDRGSSELGWLRGWYRPRALRLSLRRATRVIAVTGSLRRLMLENFPFLDPDHVGVVPLGVALPGGEPASEPSRTQKRVLAVSALWPYKRIDQAIAAFAKGTEGLDAVLEIAGPDAGNLQAELESLAEEKGVASRVVFLGIIPHARVLTLFRESDVLLYLSEIESFGLPIVEAMACGLPVIAKPIEALVEVGGEAPVWVALDASDEQVAVALRQLLLDPEAHAERARAGRERAELFTWARTGALTAATLREAAAVRDTRGSQRPQANRHIHAADE